MLVGLPIPAYITVPRAASANELAALTDELYEAGLEFEPLASDVERLTGVEVLVVAVIVTSLHAFFRRIGDDAGKDAYKAIKERIRKFRATTGQPDEGIIVMQDQASLARLDLSPELDDAAYRALLELDFATLGPGTLHWDAAAGRWTRIPMNRRPS
jgi:hypothetical protein